MTMFSDEQVLALLAEGFNRSLIVFPKGMDCRSAAIDTLTWAKTEGYAEVLRREQEWNKAKGNDPTAVEPQGPVCEACEGKGGCTLSFAPEHFIVCPVCKGKGWRPPTYEEEWIDPRSGLPRAHENPHVPKE